ncbi:hypothetical protein, partial [uncultured Rikenella sp.]|uniref:hypothetical protein n=1 Tax=uncultured Rikenella sp. TaxID=368003 RepID=UPI00263726D9
QLKCVSISRPRDVGPARPERSSRLDKAQPRAIAEEGNHSKRLALWIRYSSARGHIQPLLLFNCSRATPKERNRQNLLARFDKISLGARKN